MRNSYSRRNFLRKLLIPWSEISGTKSIGELELNPSSFCIAADFPPAFLAEEARKLGLDPDSLEREDLLQAVHQAMQKQRPPCA